MKIMNLRRISVLVLAMVAAAGCATTDPARQPRAEFEDIPVPPGLAYIESDSLIIDTPGAKVARMVYRGRVTMTAMSSAMRGNLEGNGWRRIGSSASTAQGTTQIYEKERSSLQVRVWENLVFTYLELTASRLVQETGPAAGIPSTPLSTATPR